MSREDGPRTSVLPEALPAKEWLTANPPACGQLWLSPAGKQISTGLKVAGRLLNGTRGDDGYVYEKLLGEMLKVVSTHNSKSVTLPVLHIEWEGVKFYWRDNFYDIKMSVDTGGRDLEIDFESAFFDEEISSCYFEGFKGDWIFGRYADNPSQWSMELNAFPMELVVHKVWYAIRKAEHRLLRPSRVIRDFVAWLPPDLRDLSYYSSSSVSESLLEEAEMQEQHPEILHGYGRVGTIMSLAFANKVDKEVEDACYTKMFGRPRHLKEWERRGLES